VTRGVKPIVVVSGFHVRAGTCVVSAPDVPPHVQGVEAVKSGYLFIKRVNSPYTAVPAIGADIALDTRVVRMVVGVLCMPGNGYQLDISAVGGVLMSVVTPYAQHRGPVVVDAIIAMPPSRAVEPEPAVSTKLRSAPELRDPHPVYI
jgi:hypothetical protein